MKKNVFFIAVLALTCTAFMTGHAANSTLVHYKVPAAKKHALEKFVCADKDQISTIDRLIRLEPVFQQSFHEKRHKRILEVSEYLCPVASWSFRNYSILQRDFFSGTRNFHDRQTRYHLPQRAPPFC